MNTAEKLCEFRYKIYTIMSSEKNLYDKYLLEVLEIESTKMEQNLHNNKLTLNNFNLSNASNKFAALSISIQTISNSINNILEKAVFVEDEIYNIQKLSADITSEVSNIKSILYKLERV
jgi:hypothetical protein